MILDRQHQTPGWLSINSDVPLEQIVGDTDITVANAAAVARTLGVSLATIAGEESPLTVTELAAAMKVSTDTIYRKASAGDIPGIKFGGSWRFYLSEVIAAARPNKADLWEQPTRAKNRRVA